VISRILQHRLIQPFLTRRFIKFAMVGATGVVVNLGFLALFRSIGVHINASSALAIELSVISNFLINHAWTFRDRRGPAGLLRQAGRFHLVSLVGVIVQFSVFVAMNVVWLFTVLDDAARLAYLSAADTWFERWIWHPLAAPPDTGWLAYASQLIGIGCGMVWYYLLNFYWTWSERASRV